MSNFLNGAKPDSVQVATDPKTGRTYVNNDQTAFDKFVKSTGAKPVDADFVSTYSPEKK